MRSKNPVLFAIVAVVFTFIFGTANIAMAETFCPEGGERFTGSEKFCPSHGATLQPVAKAKSSALSGNGTVESEAAKQKQAAEWYKQAKNYYAGDGVEVDQAKAMSLHKKAANAGNSVAQVSLGFIYEIGDEGFKINFTEALKWYRMAVAQGDPVGRYSLGNMYQAGKGVEQDYAKAARLYSEAAEEESRGRHLAQQQLGDLYLEGKGVGKDLEKAEAYWLAAVGTGYAFSQALLGLRYEYGAFGRVELNKARQYYRLAARRGHKEAEAAFARLNTGKVKEVLIAAGYTFVRVKIGSAENWVAAPEFAVKEGDMVEVPLGTEMRNYTSSTLGREFEVVSFVSSIKIIDEVDPKIRALQSVLAKDPSNRRAWVDLGNRCFDLGKHHKAIEAYGKALEMDPSDIAVINDLAVMYKRTGEIEKAVATAHKTLDIDSTNKQALFNLGTMYGYDLKDYKSAVNYWSKLLKYYPDLDNAEQVRSEIAVMKKNEKIR